MAEDQMIYPTSPMPVEMHHAIHTTPPGAHSEGVEHVESPGKSEGMLSKMKHKAKMLRDKIKVAAGIDSTDNDHGDINRRDQEDELHQHAPGPEGEDVHKGAEGDEEEHDHVNPADNQFKHQQLHSIDALENQGGPEVKVHGGVPVTAPGGTPDAQLKSADDDACTSPCKNDGPPDALQATTPTKYHNSVADNDPQLQLGGEGKTTTDPSDVNLVRTAEGNNSRGLNQQPDSLGLPALAEVKMATPPTGLSRNSATSDMDADYTKDLVKPNPEFGHSSSTTYDKIDVMNEDLSTDRKLGTSEDYNNKGKEDVLEHQSSASVPVEADELPVSELSGYQSSAQVPIKADELVYRPNSNPDEGSSLTPPPDAISQAAGTQQSVDNSTRQAFANDIDYTSNHDDVKRLSLEQSPHGEAAEPEKNQHESWSKWSADKHDKVKDDKVDDEVSSLTSPPGTLDGVTNEPNAVTQSYGTGERLDNRTSAFAKETDYPSTSVEEEKPISNTANSVENLSLEQSAHGETFEPEKNQDGWNKNAADGAVAMRVGSGDRVQDDEYVDALSKPQVSEDVRKDVDKEYFYDPNEVKENQFQKGFALGSTDADENALNSSLPGSAIGELEGVPSTVGYGNTSSLRSEGGGDGEENPYFEREDVNFSPTQQQTGLVQGPKDTVASTFGYGKETADEFSHRDEGEQSRVAEREHKPEVDIDGSQPQTGAALEGLKNVVSSKLGYGAAGELPSPSENMRAHNTHVETTADAEARYDDGGEHVGVGKVAGDDADTEGESHSPQQGVAGNNAETEGESHSPQQSVAGNNVDTEGESHNPQQTGVFQGMKHMVSSTLGYGGSEGAHTAETGHMTHNEVPAVSSTEGESHSQQRTGIFQGMKNMLGYGSEGAHTAQAGHATHDEVPVV